jgi:glutamate 5-kinase
MSVPNWQRAVLKVGSNLIAPAGEALSEQHVAGIARVVRDARAQGRQVIVVSSGAVAAGRATLRAAGRAAPTGIAGKQALAALGQAQLMRFWAGFFDVPVAQLLLSHDDLVQRRRFVNVKNTLRELLALGLVPIVNENDSVAVEELTLGDNDNLAAHVAASAEADLLVLCTDIDGLYDADPRRNAGARRLERVARVDATVMALAGAAGSAVGTGGMRTKLEAAAKAADAGIPTAIVHGGRESALRTLLGGPLDGTWIEAATSRRAAKKHWMLHALPVSGTIEVDAGAARAIAEQGASLLPSGVRGSSGRFAPGDAVEVTCAGERIAKGLAQFGDQDLGRILGRRSAEIATLLGEGAAETVIHRDDLVLLR